MSFSQHHEDDFIKAMFPADFKGTVLEIGAYGPTMLSNSRLFIESGWRAILVEPSPAPLRALLQEYGNNPAVQIFAGAVGIGEEHEFSVAQFDISDGPLSTDQPAAREFWKEDAGFVGKLTVPVFPAWFFADVACDFLSVDTEGSSIRVLESLLKFLRPKVICVEREEAQMARLPHLCAAGGYEIIHHEPSAGINRILKLKGFRS